MTSESSLNNQHDLSYIQNNRCTDTCTLSMSIFAYVDVIVKTCMGLGLEGIYEYLLSNSLIICRSIY